MEKVLAIFPTGGYNHYVSLPFSPYFRGFSAMRERNGATYIFYSRKLE